MTQFITGKRIVAFVLVALLQFTAVALYAQAAGSSLSGTIVDGSGGAIPSAQVTVTNVATGAKKDVQADNNGHYVASSLSAGTYTVEASAIGFTMNSRPGVVLAEGQSQQVGLALTISTVVQEVTVNGGIESIAAEAAPSGGFVEERSARSLVSNSYIEFHEPHRRLRRDCSDRSRRIHDEFRRRWPRPEQDLLPRFS